MSSTAPNLALSKSARIAAAQAQRQEAAREEVSRLNPPWPFEALPIPAPLLDPANNATLPERAAQAPD